MMTFLKSFFSNEKSAEELALMAGVKKRDVMMVDGSPSEDEEEQAGGCGTQQKSSGCGGCGCG